MGLGEEKARLGEEILNEQDDDSDPEDAEEEAPEDAGGDDEEEEEEEELIDPGDAVREKCAEHPECTQFKLELETCNNRVNSRSQTEETCVQELFDFLECHDKCLAHNLFSKLK